MSKPLFGFLLILAVWAALMASSALAMWLSSVKGWTSWFGIAVATGLYLLAHWWVATVGEMHKDHPQSKFWAWWDDVLARAAGQPRRK
jgi:hypothetical protein